MNNLVEWYFPNCPLGNWKKPFFSLLTCLKEQGLSLGKILSEFPNLKHLNLDYNQLNARNLENLTSEQLDKLVTGIRDKKIRLNSNKGTILMDLLE